VTRDWDAHLISHFDDSVGAVGPVSNSVSGLQRLELYLKENVPAKIDLDRLQENLYSRNQGTPVETKLLIGFCLMVPRKVIDMIGPLDEDLFLGNEDLEYSLRLRQNGYTLLVATDTFVYHKGQVSFNSQPSTRARELVQEGADKLFSKLEKHYGPGKVPSSMDLWGMDWFHPRKNVFSSPAMTQPAQAGLTSIVVLTFNQMKYTKECVKSIQAHTPEPHEIIFVDNRSTDGTLKWLRKLVAKHDHYTLIENPENFGFARGCNQGIRASAGEFVLLLNNDVVVTDHWLSGMLECIESDSDIGIVGPMTNNRVEDICRAISGSEQTPPDSVEKNCRLLYAFQTRPRGDRGTAGRGLRFGEF
jgi:GT2 family glycosyltransferase